MSFQAGFEQVLTLYNPTVYETADIIDTYVYRAGLISARYSMAAAVGLFQSAMGFVLIVLPRTGWPVGMPDIAFSERGNSYGC